MKNKKSIVFYSYKGGTGRTLALANVAGYLAQFKFRVCIIDMDLEAPGIHYKFFKKTDSRIDNMLGIVDYIDYFTNNGAPPPDISEYIINYNDNISIIPSGDVLNSDYWNKLAKIDWHTLLYKENGSGVKLLLDLLGRIKSDELGFDFILIDARAGITPLSGLCVSIFGDMLVSFFTSSPESLDGTRQMLLNIQKTREKDNLEKLPTTSVLTRFEKFENPDDEKVFIEEKKLLLSNESDPLFNEFCVIHSEREIERTERIVFNMNEEENSLSDTTIREDYLNLFRCLTDDKILSTRVKSLIDEKMDRESLINEPDKVQSEVEAIAIVYNHQLIWEELLKLYKMRNIDKTDDDKFLNALVQYYNVGGEKDFVAKYYFDAFLAYSNKPLYLRSRSGVHFNFKRIFDFAEKCSSDIKFELAQVLQKNYSDIHAQKSFDLFIGLLDNEQYSIPSLTGIMNLFLKNEKIYHENEELMLSLDDSRLIKNSDLKKAVCDVYIKHSFPAQANTLLRNSDFVNRLKSSNPLKLLDFHLQKHEIFDALSIARELISFSVREYEPRQIVDLIELFSSRGYKRDLEAILPENEAVVKEALDRYHQF